MKFEVFRSFRHADLHEVKGREYAPGEYEVVERPTQPGQMSRRCAEVAEAEGWGAPLEDDEGGGRQSRASSMDDESSSSDRDPPSDETTSRRSRRKKRG